MVSTGNLRAAAGWTNLGPQYKVIKTVVVSPQDTSVIYAGAFGWGVFRSTNAGATWTPRQNGLGNTYVRSLAVISDSLVFCGTNDGVYRTTNAGSIWTFSQSTPFSVRALAYDPSGGNLYAGTYGDGIYRSTDLGGSWSHLNIVDAATIPAETLSHIWSIGVIGPDSLYAGGSILDISAGGALFQSTDAGASWVQVQRGIGIRSSVRSIAVSPNSPATSLIIGTAAKGVYKSTNGGLNWTQINAETSPGPLPDLQVNAVAFGTTRRFAGTDSVGGLYSRDLGDTLLGWTTGAGLPGPSAVISSIAPNAVNPASVYTGTEGAGIYRSVSTGSSWSPRSSGMMGVYARAVAVNGNGDVFLGGNFGDGLWNSTDQGTSWARAESLRTSNSLTSFAITGDPQVVYAGAYGSGVFRSMNAGATWALTDATTLNVFVRSAVADPSNSNIVYAGTGNGVYKTTNGGGSWAAVNAGIPASTAIRSLTIDPSNPAVLFAGTDSLFLYKTTNGGASWTHYTAANGFLPQDFDIRTVTVDYATGSIEYAGTDSGRIYRSTNSGATWSLLAQLPATHSVRSVLIHPTDRAIFFAATFGDGLFVSVDSGVHWTSMNAGLADLEISSLESDHLDPPTLYAGSASYGVYRMTYTFVNGPPVLGAIGPKSVLFNQPLAFRISAADPDGSIPSLSAGVLPPGATFFDSLNGHGRFEWTPSPADFGDHSVTFHASDGSLSDSVTVLINVLDPASSAVADVVIESGWNLVSAPVVEPDFRKITLFPGASSAAYAYTGSYTVKDTLENGPGYWLKFPSSDVVTLGGGSIVSETVAVRTGWNIFGSISSPVAVSLVIPTAPVLISSSLYGYASGSGYSIADSVLPGRGYWLKASEAGQVVIGPGPVADPAALPKAGIGGGAVEASREAGAILVRDAAGRERRLSIFTSTTVDARLSELPPVPPAGMLDARFVPSNSAGIVVSRGVIDRELSVQVSSGGGAVSISWDFNDPELALTLTNFGGPGVGDVLFRGHGMRAFVLPAGRVVGRITSDRAPASAVQGPRDFVLEQNHPNPFNPSTTIGYYLPAASNVRLTIFDLLGRVVGEPENGYRQAGSHSVSWDARGRSSGVYYYTLEVSGDGNGPERRVLTKKMFLLR